MSEHKKHAGQSLFTGIKQLVDQILFVTDIAREQIRYEQVGKLVFPMKRIHHGFLVDSQHSTICHCRCRTHTKRLASQRTFAEKAPIAQYADRRFFANFGDNSEFYLARLQIKHCVRSIPLRKDGLLFRKEHGFPALADGSEKRMWIELAAVLRTTTDLRGILGCCGYPTSRLWAGD